MNAAGTRWRFVGITATIVGVCVITIGQVGRIALIDPRASWFIGSSLVVIGSAMIVSTGRGRQRTRKGRQQGGNGTR